MIKEYLSAGYPILAVKTCEPERAQKELLNEIFNAHYENESERDQCFQWDILRGVYQSHKVLRCPQCSKTYNATDIAIHQEKQYCPTDNTELTDNGFYVSPGIQPPDNEKYPPGLFPLNWLQSQANNTVLFLWNFHKFLTPNNIEIIQTLQNYRDYWKQCGKTIVMLVPDIDIVKELDKSITIIEFNLPDAKEIKEVLKCLARGNGITIESKEEGDALVNAASGLTLFEAENAFALSHAVDNKFDPCIVLEQKSQMVKKNASLEYSHFKENFSKIGGLDNLKNFCSKVIKSDLSRGVMLLGIPGTGKCLGRGTPILMYNGTIKTVEAIQAGDLLMGPDSEPRKVINTCKGHGPLYRISPTKGDPYIVNENHVLSLKHSPTNKKGYKVVNIPLCDYINKTKQWKERHKGWRCKINWKETKTLIPPYILGLGLGDGTANAPHITTPDKEVVDAMQDYCDATELRLVTNSEKGLAKTYAMSTKKGGRSRNHFLDSLRHYGLYGNKKIPHDYLINSDKIRLELLAGIIDADGHYTCNCYDLIFANKQLAEDTIFLARSLGFAAYLSPSKKECQGGHVGTYWRFCISGNVDLIPTRIARKKGKTRKQCKDVTVTGIKAESIGDGEYFGFELDRDHLFLLGDFTVTHNSMFAKALGNEAGLPTLSLDFGKLFGSLVGESERKVREALKIIDAMAPCILFIDEIEKGLSGVQSSHQTDGGTGSRVFGSFLTWLNDHQTKVFTISTCNAINKLPPEFLRAERWDAIFFIDLPTPEERHTIFDIYKKEYQANGEPPNMDGWTGAEIKTVCRIAAMMKAPLKEAARYVIPLSRSMGSEISELKKWAEGKCIPASIAPMLHTKETRKIRSN